MVQNSANIKTYRFYIILLLGLSFNLEALSQTVAGQIVNEAGMPVEGAHIVCYPNGSFASSDFKGDFALDMSNCNAASSLKISHVLYKSKQFDVRQLAVEQLLNVVLEDTLISLEEVTLVQTTILQRLTDRTKAAILLDDEFLDKHNTGTFSEALVTLPGVNSIKVGVNIAKPVIRGMSANRILVNNRGIKQEGQQWGADHGLEIDPFDVENIEIIKGPASLLYGSDGMGGVIKIKPNDVLAANGLIVNVNSSFQTNNRAISNSVQLRGKNGSWFHEARVTHQDYGDYTVPASEYTYAGFNLPIYDNRLKNTAGNEIHYSARLGYQHTHLNTSLQFTSFNQRAGIFSGAIGLPRAYNLRHNGMYRNVDLPNQENQHNMLISNTSYRKGAHNLEVDLGIQFNSRRELSFPGAHGVLPEYAGSNLALGLYLNTYTANLRYQFNKSAKHQLLLGSQLQYMVNSKAGFEFLLPAFTSLQGGLFHYQLYDITEQWTVTGGIRYDIGTHAIQQHLQPVFNRGTLQPTGDFTERTPQFNREFGNLSGAAGVIFRANKANHLKLNMGNSFRFPTPIELASNGVHHGNFRHEMGNQNIQTENGYQVDFTFLHQSENSYIEFSTFYAYYNGYIYLAPSGNFSILPSGGTVWEYRQNDALFNGFEISANHSFPFHLNTNLAIDFVQNLNLDSELPLPLTPPPSIFTSHEYTGLFKDLSIIQNFYVAFSGRYNFRQNRTDRNERETPDSFIFGASMGFETVVANRNIQFRLGAQNLLNTPYSNHISRYRLINLPEQGRNFIFSIKIPLIEKN